MDDVQQDEQDLEPPGYSMAAGSNLRQQVEEIKDAVHGIVHDAALADKVESLLQAIEDISEEVHSWRNGKGQSYVEAIETLKLQVSEVQEEWNAVSSTLKNQRERLETLLESFPGIIETSAVRALSLRVTHLEQLVMELINESHSRSNKKTTNRQLVISLAALGVMTAFWTLSIWLSSF